VIASTIFHQDQIEKADTLFPVALKLKKREHCDQR
jgi:hypothetical protein